MTEDVRPQWLNFARRMQAASCNNRGAAIVSSRVVVDDSGNPIVWVSPEVTKIEPAAQSESAISFLSGAHFSHLAPKIAKVLDGNTIAVTLPVDKNSYYCYVYQGKIVIILRVVELRERIAILKTTFVAEDSPKIRLGDSLRQLYW